MCIVIMFLVWLQDYIPATRRKLSSQESRCQKGFTMKMSQCTDVDECNLKVPFCGKRHCFNTVGSYSCDCRKGYQVQTKIIKNYYDYTCIDIDECQKRYACPRNSICHNTKGSYSCLCNEGFSGDDCFDTDECLGNQTVCDDNAECRNTIGSYQCSCRNGFYGNGVVCQAGQCGDGSCPDNKKCVSRTTMNCECMEGFAANQNDTCSDVDECSIGNKCDLNADCLNLPGTFACVCRSGFHGNGTVCSIGQCSVQGLKY